MGVGPDGAALRGLVEALSEDISGRKNGEQRGAKAVGAVVMSVQDNFTCSRTRSNTGLCSVERNQGRSLSFAFRPEAKGEEKW